MTVDLYQRFGEHNSRRLGMYFTVGLNYGYAISEITLDNNDELESLNFVSEKVGFRYNVFDFNRKRSYLQYNSKTKNYHKKISKSHESPFVSNIHVIAYGSGLLYNIDVLNSEDVFNDPLLGYGVGVTLYNGLDFNFSYTHLLNDFSGSMFNASFDIKITEYLSELNKKRKVAKYSK